MFHLRKAIRIIRRRNTKCEKLLFELIKDRERDNIYIIKQFFEQHQHQQQQQSLKQCSFNVNCYDDDYDQGFNFTPLMTAVYYCRDDEHRTIEVIRILLENGADINMKTIKGYYLGSTALHLACLNNKCFYTSTSNVIKFLLKHGIDDLNHQDGNGSTPLLNACKDHRFDNIKTLLEFDGGVDVLFKNLDSGNGPILEIFLHPLMYRNGMNDAVQLLLEYGANVNNQNKYGDTPLHKAILLRRSSSDYNEEYSLIQLLLNANNVNINIQHFYNGDTPLHIIIRCLRIGMYQIVKLYMKYHPNLYIYNHNHKTVLDIAKEEQQRFIHNNEDNENDIYNIEIIKELDQIIICIEAEKRSQIYKYLYNCWIICNNHNKTNQKNKID